METLDKEKIKSLLRDADTKYYALPDSQKYDYARHLDFTADYLLKHLKGRKDEKDKAKNTSAGGHKGRRQNSPAGAKSKKKL